MCTYDFCGADHMLFGTDMPFDMELGNEAVRETIRSVERMEIPKEEKEAIFEKNAQEGAAARLSCNPTLLFFRTETLLD